MKRSINLVPESFRRRIVAQKLLRLWLGIAVASTALLIAYVGWEKRAYQIAAARKSAVESKARPFSEMREASQRIADQIRQIEENDALLRRLAKDQVPLLPLSLLSAGVRGSNAPIWIKHLKFEHAPSAESDTKPGSTTVAPGLPASTEAPKETKPTRGRMMIEGTAADNLAVASFVAALRDTQGFSAVELKSSVITEVDGTRHMTFSIESEL